MSKIKTIDWLPARAWFSEVNATTLRKDILAGLTGAIIVLPQGVAFAIIAGLPPIHGLYAAMIMPLVSAFFGSSKHLISGPTVAISLIIFSSVSKYAVPGSSDFLNLAIVISLVAGAIQFILGLARLGAIVNFVSHSVIIGFTAGAAILIASSQLKYFFGVDIPAGSDFIDIWISLFQSMDQYNMYTVLIGSVTIVSALLIKKIHSSIPDLLIALIISSSLSYLLFNNQNGIEVVGVLPEGLPQFNVPDITANQVKSIIPNAFAVALLGLIQSVAIGRTLGVKSGQRINANQEFIGQGLGNMFSSLFGGYAGSGSFTRSAINQRAGASTPMAAMFAALFLIMAINFVAPLAAYLPISAIAGVIVLVAYQLIDFKYIKKLLTTSRRESAVMLITFFSVLLLDVDYAIYMGIIFSLILYLRQTTQPRFVEISPDRSNPRHMFVPVKKYKLENCPQLMIYRIEGSWYFGAVEHVANGLDELLERPENNLLIVANNINLIDNTGGQFMVDVVKKWEERGKHIYFSGLKFRSREFLINGGYTKEIGNDRFFGNKEHAVEEIYKKLDHDYCQTCAVQLFRECPKRKDG